MKDEKLPIPHSHSDLPPYPFPRGGEQEGRTNNKQRTTKTQMAVKVLVPTPLQKFTNNKATIDSSGGNIIELIDALETSYPGIKEKICDESGKPRRFINFYVNSEDIRFMDNENTALSDGDEVSIVPAVAGG